MIPSRGDRKPCSHPQCAGTMQFGREPLPRTTVGLVAEGERGWVCSADAGHFQLAAGSGSDVRVTSRGPETLSSRVR